MPPEAARVSDIACSRLGDALDACARGSPTGLELLARHSVPRLLAVAQQFLATPEDIETVVHDTLGLAWHDAWRFQPADEPPEHWMMRLFGSRLNSQLKAPKIDLAGHDMPRLDIGTDPIALPPPLTRPEALSPYRLWAMAERLPPASVSSRLKARLTDALMLLENARNMPLTPSGEPADPRLFSPAIARRMRLSRLSRRTMEKLNHYVARPLERSVFALWRHQIPGSTWIERQGLPRHVIEACHASQLEIDVAPRELQHELDYQGAFPDRKQRHRIGNRLLWDGNWDVSLTAFLASRRMHFIADIWYHRRRLEQSHSYHRLAERLARGKPIVSHSDGVMLDRPERILAYLRRYHRYMESIACFGFDDQLSKDPMGVAVDRHGQLIKLNKGLHRLAMSQVIGVPSIRVRVRAIHRQWWCHTAGEARGQQALDRVLATLPSCRPRTD
ncbi:hypothetical protein [Halomonas caseinilytica]|uniref:Sigma-70 region 2 n=1 Tax=Halomonas caseinilytica TaxID=438744 RepID=A0A1M6ZD00_9GAMM|nr:hypothetical protein [Halomonas caseinilytica]SHL28358.1 hypothetical protein SAMN05192556_110102 [Halomonas caseinilytica]